MNRWMILLTIIIGWFWTVGLDHTKAWISFYLLDWYSTGKYSLTIRRKSIMSGSGYFICKLWGPTYPQGQYLLIRWPIFDCTKWYTPTTTFHAGRHGYNGEPQRQGLAHVMPCAYSNDVISHSIKWLLVIGDTLSRGGWKGLSLHANQSPCK